MFSIFKKKPQLSSGGIFPFSADIHSHILPGIDDGAPDAAASIMLIKGMMAAGITSAVATPHIIGDLYRNNHETISKALEITKNALTENQIDFKIKAAAEYMMDDYFLELLRTKTPLLTIKDNIVLTEFSYAEKPANAEEIIYNIITEGYKPVLAHPERYGYYHNDFNKFHYLSELGFLLQVNLLSVTGYYGKQVAKAAAYILKHDLASYAGTDLHHERHLAAINHPANQSVIAAAFAGKNMNEEMGF